MESADFPWPHCNVPVGDPWERKPAEVLTDSGRRAFSSSHSRPRNRSARPAAEPRRYQISTRSSGGSHMSSPGWTPKASTKGSMFRSTPFVRYSLGEWLSVSRRLRSSASR